MWDTALIRNQLDSAMGWGSRPQPSTIPPSYNGEYSTLLKCECGFDSCRRCQINNSRVAQRKSNRLISDRSTFRNCPWLPNNGVYSVVACILVCETGGTGSIPVRHPRSVISVVEYHVDIVKVAGSNPAPTTKRSCQLSKCGHCGGLKIRGTWFDPGSWHQI